MKDYLLRALVLAGMLCPTLLHASQWEPGIGCSQWNYFPITCENTGDCVYDYRTNHCLEDLGATPNCHHWDDAPRGCALIYHCTYDWSTRSCQLEATAG